MAQSIERITLKGYKSIQHLEDFSLKNINILIGANGCGKSNFVRFFYLLRQIIDGYLARTVNLSGGADLHLFLGTKVTQAIETEIVFGRNAYSFVLQPTVDNRLIFTDERIFYDASGRMSLSVNRSIGNGHDESKLLAQIENNTYSKTISKYIYDSISKWVVYHFHDTSSTAQVRRECSIRDNENLRADASNLAAFLFFLLEHHFDIYKGIVDVIKLVTPFFKDFKLRVKEQRNDQFVLLEWQQEGSDYPFHPSQLSDGTLRFIALVTALMQPNPPATMLFDEPELGLHPYAIEVLANLISQTGENTQVIISTQSSQLLDNFEPDNIIVVDRHNGASSFKRLDNEQLDTWLEDYTMGELWQKNVYGGGPTYE